MQLDRTVKLLLAFIALLLAALVFRPVAQPTIVQAQSSSSDFYVEPGYTMLRKPDGSGQMYGKMMIDMRTGDIWGFPTLDQSPYPVDTTKSEPPRSRPMYLGKFVLSDAHR